MVLLVSAQVEPMFIAKWNLVTFIINQELVLPLISIIIYHKSCVMMYVMLDGMVTILLLHVKDVYMIVIHVQMELHVKLAMLQKILDK